MANLGINFLINMAPIRKNKADCHTSRAPSNQRRTNGATDGLTEICFVIGFVGVEEIVMCSMMPELVVNLQKTRVKTPKSAPEAIVG